MNKGPKIHEALVTAFVSIFCRILQLSTMDL